MQEKNLKDHKWRKRKIANRWAETNKGHFRKEELYWQQSGKVTLGAEKSRKLIVSVKEKHFETKMQTHVNYYLRVKRRIFLAYLILKKA